MAPPVTATIYFTVIACYGIDIAISCANGETIEIKYANYGRASKQEGSCGYAANKRAYTKCIVAISENTIRSE